ncbi:25897_t:CDS:2 [Dentiscutata erythropus]|uniref:25897_t:CDS:1 n=1 Tax=Dentiscutata erythropus TaxID=1348616 RepID=A0A9N8WDV0_9GLOM|nr:25897_t:CDS:2 [Dentiscutata erythropus]
MQNYNGVDAKALAYAQRREGKCLAKVNPNIYLWCNICSNVPERTCRYIFEDLLHKKFPLRKPKFLEELYLDGYNEELGLAFKYSGNQYYQIVPFFHPQEQINLDAQIWHDWKKRALCYRKGVILITIPYCAIDLEAFIRSTLYAFGFFPIRTI